MNGVNGQGLSLIPLLGTSSHTSRILIIFTDIACKGQNILGLSVTKKTDGDFLPDLCTPQAVFSLILVGELLSFSFVVIDLGFTQFEWAHFGAVSFLVQWIVLASAACLCPLRPWLKHQIGLVAGTVSYGIVLLLTAVFTLLGQWLSAQNFFKNNMTVLENLMISAIFAGVVLRYFYLQQQLHNREQAELQARIQALQSRIRPHFLFNSMNSIVSLIDIDPKAAEKMVLDLAQLFRASLSELSIVSLEDEVKLCKQFVSIEKTRLGDRLELDWQISMGEKPVEIPSLLLQPLIENAIYHGVQPLPEGGTVTVKIDVGDQYVNIDVRNPFTAPTAISQDDSKNNGMALENIYHRLQAHYDDLANIESSQNNNEFSISIRYPIHYIKK